MNDSDLFGNIQPKNPYSKDSKDSKDSFEVYQTLALMELYSGVEMKFAKKIENGKEQIDYDNFTMEYFNKETGETVKLVTGEKNKTDDNPYGKISWKVDVSSEDPKIWDKALCVMVDQSKKLMNMPRGTAEQSFPITGKAHPEKMLRLYQLAMMNNLISKLNSEQLDHIAQYDAQHGTKYSKVLHHLENHNIVDELKRVHIQDMMEKFKAENFGKTPAELGEDAENLASAEINAEGINARLVNKV